MASSLLVAPFAATVNRISAHCSKIYGGFRICNHPTVRLPVVPSRPIRFASSAQKSHSHSNSPPNDEEEEEEEGLVKDLRVPEQWLDPSKALEVTEILLLKRISTYALFVCAAFVCRLWDPQNFMMEKVYNMAFEEMIQEQESKWLRVNLHKWLDDEYCPEPTNVEISNIAAYSYYESLLQRQTDLGEILLKMARELESISYQESFHGAFSSANAAVNLIIQRLELD
ncbi:hypothetical protein C3L33_07562, partial [Rhododendron williamsianum]